MRAAVLVLLVCLTGCEEKPAGKGKGGGVTTPPKAGGSTKFKNATELGAFLNSKGVKGTINPGGIYDRPERPCSTFNAESGGLTFIYLCKTESDADELVGSSGKDNAFRYGRFALVNQFATRADSRKVLEEIRQILR